MGMQRRRFLAGLAAHSAVATTVAVASGAAHKSRDLAQTSLERMGHKIETLGKRVDSLEGRQKQLTRTLIVVTAISTGIDLSLIV